MTGHSTEFADCGEIRQALGVYVVGAIDPAERATVDAHLARCPACREELAGLAGLPALLGRVPAADAERFALGEEVPDEEPSAEVLDSLLQRVSARHRARRWQFAVAAAAAVIVAVGGGLAGGAAVSHGSAAPSAASYLARGTDSATNVDAAVFYNSTSSGLKMQVQAAGVKPGSPCVFWVITRGGQHIVAGSWMATNNAAQWYPAASKYQLSQLSGFDISINNNVIVRVPLTT